LIVKLFGLPGWACDNSTRNTPFNGDGNDYSTLIAILRGCACSAFGMRRTRVNLAAFFNRFGGLIYKVAPTSFQGRLMRLALGLLATPRGNERQNIL
jgi:hypothetical protein